MNNTKDLKRRIQRLEERLALITEFASVIQFQNQQEYETVVMIAANENMTLTNYVRSCVIKVTNELLAIQVEERQELARKQEAEAVAAVEAAEIETVPVDESAGVSSEA